MPTARTHGAIPARAGVGLKPDHYKDVLSGAGGAGWFEVHAENYMCVGGQPHHYLEAIRTRYPISVHGVGLSIGSAQGLDETHLARLKVVCARYEPGLVSEHLAWSTHGDFYLNDLLPLPYTGEVLQQVSEHVDHVQTVLGRQILIENPSTYLLFEASEMDEVGFLEQLSVRTGCGLLLDVNNVFVSATNHNFDPHDYLVRFPVQLVQEIHIAGHAVDEDNAGAPLLIDSHDTPVSVNVWDLYGEVVRRLGAVPTLIERDGNLPVWDELAREAKFADQQMQEVVGDVVYG